MIEGAKGIESIFRSVTGAFTIKVQAAGHEIGMVMELGVERLGQDGGWWGAEKRIPRIVTG